MSSDTMNRDTDRDSNAYPTDGEWPWSSSDPRDDIPDLDGRRFTMTIGAFFDYADGHVETAMERALTVAVSALYPNGCRSLERHRQLKEQVLLSHSDLVIALLHAHVETRRAFLDAATRQDIPLEISLSSVSGENGDIQNGSAYPPDWVLRRHDPAPQSKDDQPPAPEPDDDLLG